jgi:hypothetical protein
MRTKTMSTVAGTAVLSVAALWLVSLSGDLAAQEPKEVVTTQGSFPLTDNGLPEQKTIPALFDELDYQGAVQAYLWAMPQMTVAGQHHSNKYYGAKDSTDFLYMYKDPSVPGMLTPNTIVQYIVNFYNFAENGPMVMETPGGQVVGMIMDYQQRWVADTGLIAPAGANPETIVYVGPHQEAPDEALTKGWRVIPVRTNVILTAMRILNPEKDQALAKAYRIYPYSQRSNPPANKVFQAKPSDKTYFIAAPKGMAYWERLHEIVQQELVLETDRYYMNSLQAIGIEKGKPFKPTKRQQEIMKRAAFTGEKMAMAMSFVPRSPEAKYRDDSRWFLPLTLQPEHITRYTEQFEERVAWTYSAYGVSPSMKAKIPGKGSVYFATYQDKDGDWLDGGKNYKFTVAPNPPAAQFWAYTIYNVATRGIILNGDDNRTEISSLIKEVKTNTDGSVDLYFGPEAPAGKESNWIKTNEGENWFAYFRLYAPTEKYFDRSWPINDLETVK